MKSFIASTQQFEIKKVTEDWAILFHTLIKICFARSLNSAANVFVVVGCAISRCLSTTPHPMNRAWGWYTFVH